MPSTKVYIHYEEGDESRHMTLKIKVPKKWLSGPVDNLKEVRKPAMPPPLGEALLV